jgi:hypothetical protein
LQSLNELRDGGDCVIREHVTVQLRLQIQHRRGVGAVPVGSSPTGHLVAVDPSAM